MIPNTVLVICDTIIHQKFQVWLTRYEFLSSSLKKPVSNKAMVPDTLVSIYMIYWILNIGNSDWRHSNESKLVKDNTRKQTKNNGIKMQSWSCWHGCLCCHVTEYMSTYCLFKLLIFGRRWWLLLLSQFILSLLYHCIKHLLCYTRLLLTELSWQEVNTLLYSNKIDCCHCINTTIKCKCLKTNHPIYLLNPSFKIHILVILVFFNTVYLFNSYKHNLQCK